MMAPRYRGSQKPGWLPGGLGPGVSPGPTSGLFEVEVSVSTMRRLIPFLVLFAAAPAASQAVVMDPELALAAERIFGAMDTEVVFCLTAEPGVQGGWRVTDVQLAPQGTDFGRDGASFACRDADGFMHNHPRQGTRWCRFSDTDRGTLEDYAFAVLWCPDKRFVYEVRVPSVAWAPALDTGPEESASVERQPSCPPTLPPLPPGRLRP